MNFICSVIDAIEETYKNKGIDSIYQHFCEIKIKTEAIGEQVILRIADNGSGINKADKTKIFDAFYTTKPVGKGTGLGLSIAYQIVVNNHHGKLTYHSNVGEGIEFIIELPIR